MTSLEAESSSRIALLIINDDVLSSRGDGTMSPGSESAADVWVIDWSVFDVFDEDDEDVNDVDVDDEDEDATLVKVKV